MKTPLSFRSPWHLFVSTLALAGAGAFAQTQETQPLPMTDLVLESAFWDCDVLAAQEAMSTSVGVECSQLYEEFKQRRFGGDFTSLLAWWQEHKESEHAARNGNVAVTCDADCRALEAP